jgi:hypothetical protein
VFLITHTPHQLSQVKPTRDLTCVGMSARGEGMGKGRGTAAIKAATAMNKDVGHDCLGSAAAPQQYHQNLPASSASIRPSVTSNMMHERPSSTCQQPNYTRRMMGPLVNHQLAVSNKTSIAAATAPDHQYVLCIGIWSYPLRSFIFVIV